MEYGETFEFMVECANKSFSPRARRFVNELYNESIRLRNVLEEIAYSGRPEFDEDGMDDIMMRAVARKALESK